MALNVDLLSLAQAGLARHCLEEQNTRVHDAVKMRVLLFFVQFESDQGLDELPKRRQVLSNEIFIFIQDPTELLFDRPIRRQNGNCFSQRKRYFFHIRQKNRVKFFFVSVSQFFRHLKNQ